jgi:hypothetical protein
VGWKLLIQLAGELFTRWLSQLNLKKQGASEQKLKDQEAANEKLRKAIDARNRLTKSGDHGVRESDFRD